MERSRAQQVYRFLNLFLAFLAALLCGAAGWGLLLFHSPGPLGTDTDIYFPRGTNLDNISQQLKQSGVIKRIGVFQIGVRVLGNSRQLKAGEFKFPARVSPQEAMKILVKGETVIRRLTIPEGLVRSEIFQLVRNAEGLDGHFRTETGKEGSYLPDTYHFSFGDQREDVLARMQDAMTKTLKSLWASRDDNLHLRSPHEALTLASIVERETSLASERARIAGVFINRLRQGMRLQSDPTVAYAISGDGRPLGRPLTRTDLSFQHPYNTYTIAGLPPGPICNPGRDSISAVMHPIQTEELYFVADGTGGHAFARTLQEHLKNVAQWRRIQREHK